MTKPAVAWTDENQAGLEAANWFFETGLDIFLVTRMDEIVRVNAAWAKLTGWSVEETLGKRVSAFSHEGDAEILDALRASLDQHGHVRSEHRIRAKSGRWLWVRSRAKRDRSGQALVILQDITEERQRTEEEERALRSRDLLRETAGVHTWVFDPASGRYDFDPEGRSGRASLGDQAVVKTASDMLKGMHPDDVVAIRKLWSHTLKTGEPATMEYRRLSADGTCTRFRTAWRGTRRIASGDWGIVGVTQDITELADARDAALQGEVAARSAAEAKAQFLANISHEIRTPLNGVVGVMHLLKAEPLTTDGKRLLDEAIACGSMLTTLLNDVIDFSKIEAGKLELSPEPICPADALRGVVDLLDPQAQAKGVALRTVVAPDIGWALVDPVRLRQTLFNLIGNAVKFTLAGSVEARLSTAGAGSEQRLLVEIQDTGVGIPLEAQAGLFERFQQADGSTTRKFGGSGLGLSISRRLVEMMDGEVSFSSVEGQGSTFRFEIAAPATAPAQEGSQASDAVLHGLRILAVEDNGTNRLIISRMLAQLGASVTLAEDGAQGLEAARTEAFDLILMDIQMPVMDGVAATQAIRQLPGPAALTPIIAMTANAMAHQTEAYFRAGMNGSVSKPISPASLLSELGRVIGEDEAYALTDQEPLVVRG